MEKQLKLIIALRQAAEEIKNSPNYQWGNMGSCNCGFLAQKLTGLTKAEIHRNAMAKVGDWSEQLNDYCPNSGYPMDNLIFDLLQNGLSIEELAALERLSDPKVISSIDDGYKPLSFNKADDVFIYMNAWANLLEEELLKSISIQSISAYSFNKPLALIK